MTGSADLLLADEAATCALGARLVPALRPGDVLLLAGGLGTGKTTLARAGIQAALGGPAEVPSPTFTLVQTYDLPAGTLWHFDLYRLGDPAEVLELGFEDAVADGIVLVEWPDRLGPLLPARHATVDLIAEPGSDRRRAHLSFVGDWRGSSLPLL
ncbi:MAG: tRNA (adenosine(37)-N6)-threonylcarbamoyltransferase complex ATPase subunit type 1 TsaE [Rhodospirillaceae bacterium]|nr:tRNA (adenosine(37)-N6)-threonylcarbamoyltransferase complex ATPase subunit type 1 TsaE [Rhodospirillaceae bacterium]